MTSAPQSRPTQDCLQPREHCHAGRVRLLASYLHRPLAEAVEQTEGGEGNQRRSPSLLLLSRSTDVVIVLTTAQDKTLHLHSLLHKELHILQCPWPRCEVVFGVPSKLKTPHFLSHDMVLAAEEKCTIDINARVLMTSNLIRTIKGKKHSEQDLLALVDNFTEASLDASLILEELKMDTEVENMSEESFLQSWEWNLTRHINYRTTQSRRIRNSSTYTQSRTIQKETVN